MYQDQGQGQPQEEQPTQPENDDVVDAEFEEKK
jgi:hypothetical protein